MGKMYKNGLALFLIMVLIGLSCLHELQAVPVSRTLSLARRENYFSRGSNSQMFEEEKRRVDEEEQFLHGRSDLVDQDYPGSGANRSHEPGGGSRSPGRNPP